MTDNLSSASIQAANAAPTPAPVSTVKAVEAEAESFFTKHEKAIVIAGVVFFVGLVIAVVSTL